MLYLNIYSAYAGPPCSRIYRMLTERGGTEYESKQIADEVGISLAHVNVAGAFRRIISPRGNA